MRETYYMRIYMGVENFAKIESAEICINQYTLLVGPNNSGKTFLMQLAEGINEKMEDIIHGNDLQFLMYVFQCPRPSVQTHPDCRKGTSDD